MKSIPVIAVRCLVMFCCALAVPGTCGPATAQGPTKASAAPQKADRPLEGVKGTPPRQEARAAYDLLLRGTAVLLGNDKDGSGWSGTGWIVDLKRRLMVTNWHVADPESRGKMKSLTAWFPVVKDGEPIHEVDFYEKNVKRIPATIIYTDAKRDLALVQLESVPDTAIEFKFAAGSPPTGTRLHSLGGLPRGSRGLFIYTQGTSRAIYVRNIATGGEIRVLETQMPLNQGNSGGPIVNDEGEVVAVFEGLNLEPGVQLVNVCINLDEVHAFLKDALALVEPGAPADWNKRGNHHYDCKRYDLAIADYNQALKLDPRNADAAANRGWVYFQWGDLDTALAEFNSALKLDEKSTNALSGRGTVYRDREKYGESLVDFTEAIRLTSDDKELADLYNERGNTHYANAKYEAALADYDRAIEKHPGGAWPHANRGDALGQLKRYDDAFASLDKAIVIEPQNAQFWNIAGNIWFERARYDFAANMYAQAIRRSPNEALYYRNRGRALREQGQNQDAVVELTKAVELAPREHEYWNEVGLAWYGAQRYDLAVPAFAKAIAIDASVAIYFSNRGDSHQKMGQHNEAITDLTKAIELADAADLRALRGNSYQALGNTKAAKADFDKATSIDASYKVYDRKYIKIINETGEKLEVRLKYFTKTTEGQWKWFPSKPGGEDSVSYTFGPGEGGVLFHDEWKVNGSRFRIWGSAGGRSWNEFRDRDYLPVPEGGYLTSDDDYETAVFVFPTR